MITSENKISEDHFKFVNLSKPYPPNPRKITIPIIKYQPAIKTSILLVNQSKHPKLQGKSKKIYEPIAN